jgi:hypothetical protein
VLFLLNLFFIFVIIDSAISLEYARSQNDYLENKDVEKDAAILNSLKTCWIGKPKEEIRKIDHNYTEIRGKKIISSDYLTFSIKDGMVVDVFYTPDMSYTLEE